MKANKSMYESVRLCKLRKRAGGKWKADSPHELLAGLVHARDTHRFVDELENGLDELLVAHEVVPIVTQPRLFVCGTRHDTRILNVGHEHGIEFGHIQ